ncbi:unnamed protein product [Symbiodinium microadriaticum]|nr:unnamed protein product [Symbiodinium microadriaticum]CAE7943767.1 unnamed protein product [Symbiodinium sp. KB8]
MGQSRLLSLALVSIFLLRATERTFLGVRQQPLHYLARRARSCSAPDTSAMSSVSFSHVHIYCDALKDLAEYKKLEEKLNEFGRQPLDNVAAGRDAWLALASSHGNPVTGERDPQKWTGHKQDVVEQMLVGLGWRVTGFGQTASTRSVAVTSSDNEGVKFVITAHKDKSMADFASADGHPAAKRQKSEKEAFDHLGESHLERFSQHQAGRQGVAVLGFQVNSGELDGIVAKYAEKHPKLLPPGMPKEYPGVRILEVYAYYQGEKNTTEVDCGTMLRFVECSDQNADHSVLPGIEKVPATFDPSSLPAYCDHWVSNVVSRRGFLDTLEDTLGFSPKVDFNAGVVAAGEAQIESTVTGNEPGTFIANDQIALKDQSQVYLPINNALSEVGHVHLYLQEIGQGVQHIASRVADLPALVQRANDWRRMTGAGVSFLSIPRSYYGSLTQKYLHKVAGLDDAMAQKVLASLKAASVVDASDIVDLDVSKEKIMAALPEGCDEDLVIHILRARYGNLYALLRDNIGEETYLRIVRNNVLVDVQGEDLLMQIFTSSILQRAPGEEAPFLEFIQRVCSDRKDPVSGEPRPIKAGCGGFGIRNFLTLFLSIEVSKATKARGEAEAAGNLGLANYYGSMVDAFTSQLDESNPVLTAISDAMTAEGEALEAGNGPEAAKWAEEKARGQQKLQEISKKYKEHMRSLRERAPVEA